MSAATGQHLTAQEPLTATASQATSDPVRDQNTSDLSPESRPELGMNGVTDGTTAAAPTGPNVSNVTKEEKLGKGEVMVESQPINEGILNYKGPGLKGLIFSKKYFWLSDAPLEHGHLAGYLGSEKLKDIAHPNAAHATQTGKGLLFYAKRAEDKDHPQGIFNLADVSDVVKGNFNDFGFTLHGHKHNFQATNKTEKDAWLVTIETGAAEAKTAREGIVGSSGYKSQLEKYGMLAPDALIHIADADIYMTGAGAAATTGTSRSRSRGMMASKSRERKTKDTTTHTSPEAAAAAFDTTPEATTGTTSSDTPNTVTDTTTGTTSGTTTNAATGVNTGEHVGEVAAGGAAVGAVAGAAATRSGSTSEEEKSKAAKKSRSQSRNNKRSSIFGGLLGKKEDKNLEKEEKKEEKAEDKAIKKEIKNEDKADLKELKKEEKAEKKEDKAIRKEDKAVAKDLKHENKAETQELREEAKLQGVAKTGEFDAVAVASRVIGEPVVPAGGAITGAGASGVAPVAGAEPAVAETTPASTTRETAPKPNKRGSIFGSIFGKKDAPTLASAETPPAVPAKDDQSAVSSTAPQLDNPVTSPTAETTAATTETPATAAEATAPVAATSPLSPTDKRRTSFFGNLGTKKERRTGATSENDIPDGEGKKQASSGFGGLLRKASRAQKGSSSTASKDAANVPLPTDTPAEAATNGETLAEKTATTGGVTGTHEQTPVSATT